jgi:polyhydroxybutyrate depolymerase
MRTHPLFSSLLRAAPLLLLLTGCAGAQRARGGSDAGVRTLVHEGRSRSYVVRAPRAASSTPRPVVVMLHGGGGSASNGERMSGFTSLVEREGIIVVYPEGTSRRAPLYTWNAGHCCAYAMQSRVNDVGFLDAVLDAVASEFRVDPRRVYVTGMSNGGMMAHRYARERSARVAAIAPVVASLFGDETPAAGPVAVLAINGATDELIPVDGGGTGRGLAGGFDGKATLPVSSQGRYWATANGCTATPTSERVGTVTHTRYACPAGRTVELQLVHDNGHAWPGGQRGSTRADGPSRTVDATERIWAFFSAHPKP